MEGERFGPETAVGGEENRRGVERRGPRGGGERRPRFRARSQVAPRGVGPVTVLGSGGRPGEVRLGGGAGPPVRAPSLFSILDSQGRQQEPVTYILKQTNVVICKERRLGNVVFLPDSHCPPKNLRFQY